MPVVGWVVSPGRAGSGQILCHQAAVIGTYGRGMKTSIPPVQVRLLYGLLIPLLLIAVGVTYWLTDGSLVVAVVGGITWFVLLIVGGVLVARAQRS